MDKINWYFYTGYGSYIALVVILSAIVLGWLAGRSRVKNKSGEAGYIYGNYQDAVFGLVALVIGFTFATAMHHYDERKENVRQTATSISTVYHYSEYLMPDDRDRLRQMLRQYLDSRIDLHKDLTDLSELEIKSRKITVFGRQILTFVLQAVDRSSGNDKLLSSELLKPQVISMLNIYDSGRLLMLGGPNVMVYLVLLLYLGVAGFMGGYEMSIKRERDIVFTGLYILVITVMLHLVFEMEYPVSSTEQQLRFNAELVKLRAEIFI